jgi:surface polysaccharide O-acyltransferase-like enzyme
MALYMRTPYVEFYFGPDDTLWDQIVRPAILYYWHGGVMAYWYIPFIMCMFLISPLFILFIHRSLYERIFIVSLLTLIAVVVHRPVNNWFIPQSVIYFSPVYMFGILCSMEKEWMYNKLMGKDIFLFFAVIALAVLQAIMTMTCGNLQKPIFEFNGIDVSFFQKFFLCLFFMVFLHRFENNDYRVLKQLAASSFSIYFLHGWVIYVIWLIQDYVVPKSYYAPYLGLHLLFPLSALVIWLSYLAALRVKRSFPDKSRMLIGW